MGQKQTFAAQQPMSALPPKADIRSAQAYVRFVPEADIVACNWSKFAAIEGNSHFRKGRINPSYLIVGIYFCADFLSTKYRYVGRARGN